MRYSAGSALALGFGGTAILILGALGWSVLASVSGAVIATGWVATETRNQTVEHIDGGTVKEILVREGDLVEKDAVLVRLADGLLRSEEAILLTQFAELVARRNRLEAEFRGADTINWDPDLVDLTTRSAEAKDIVDGQERVFRARIAAYEGEAKQLRERIGQAKNEILGLEAQATAFRDQSALIAQELEAQGSLFEQGLTRLSKLLSLQRAAKSLDGQSGEADALIAQVRGQIAEMELQLLQIDASRIREAEERARDVSVRENEIRERLASVREQLGRMEVRAPVAGQVFEMAIFAPREVVSPGETIMRIVPNDAKLVVTARVQPIDIDQIHPQQSAVLRFSAFPSRKAPEFDGRVERMSADVVRDEASGLSWYEVELGLEEGAEKDGMSRLPGGLPVMPGMPVEVYFQTGERTIADYLATPVTDFFRRSMREE